MNEESGTTQKRLTRSTSNKVIAGVAGGLAEYTGLDPVIFRIGLIALAVAGGSGLLIYLLAWLVLPREGETSSPGAGIVERARMGRWLPLVLIAVAVIILIETLGSWGGPALWAVALIAVGIVLLQDEPEVTASPVESRAVSETVSATSAKTLRVRRRRSPLGAYTLGATMLGIAIAVGLSGADIIELDAGQYLGLALFLVGAGLVVGAWWGRARLLIVGGLLLIPFALAGSALSVPLHGHVGDRWVNGRFQLQDRYELLAGTLHLDLSRHRFGAEPTEVTIDFVFGDVDVWVPPGVEVTTDVTMDGGSLDVFGEGRDGSDLALTTASSKPGLTEGELILHVRGGLGSFDTSWANWVEHDKRRRLEQIEERKEEAQDGQRAATTGDGRRNDKD